MRRLTRTLVYEGPDEWIAECLNRRAVKGEMSKAFLSRPRSLKEVSYVVEEIPTTTREKLFERAEEALRELDGDQLGAIEENWFSKEET